MISRNNSIERNPASGRPLMRDIASKASRLTPKAAEEKSAKKSEYPLKKKGVAKEIFLEKVPAIKKKERKFSFPKTRNAIIFLGVIILLAAIFFLGKPLSSVLIMVTPRQSFSDIDLNFEASSNSASAASLEIVSAEDTIELDGSIDKTSIASEKAHGQIVIFNAYSTQPQILVASTRFEATGGKIYRIKNNITIPGGKMENGKLVPGQLEVAVYADQSGSQYNLGLSDFTIPGLKGMPKFEKIYARSKTEMSGGSSGEVKIVTQEIINNLLIQAQENFRRSIRSKIQKDLPEGVYIPESAIDVKVTLLGADPKINSVADKVHIKAKALAQVTVLKKSDITKSLSAEYLDLNSAESVEIKNLDDLNFNILNRNSTEKKIVFRITGRAHFVWIFDESALKKDLAGAPRDARKDVFKNYSGIDRAEIIFIPSWLRFFPTDPNKIKFDYADIKD